MHYVNICPCSVKLALDVHYTDDYPDELPEFHLEVTEGSLDEQETEDLLNELKTVVCMKLQLSNFLVGI